MLRRRLARPLAWVILLALALAASGCSTDSGTTTDPVAERLDAVMESYLSHERFSGTVLLARDGEPILREAYGLANWEEGGPALRVDTPFNIGSIGKMFTQVLVLQRVEAGDWQLDDTLGSLWPESGVPNADRMTLRHLLSHQSGLGSYFGHPDYSLAQRSLDDMLALIRTQDLVFEEPGESLSYSNSAFWVLAALLERYDDDGRGWFEIYQQDVFEVAGMDGIRVFQPDEAADDRPRGYYFTPVGERSDRTGEDPRPGPDGGLYMGVDDLWAFHQALAAGAWYSQSMFETSIETYGPMVVPGCSAALTWEVCELEGVQLVSKGGTTEGGGAQYIRFEKGGHDYVLIMLSNFSNAPMLVYQDVLRYVWEIPGSGLASEAPAIAVNRALESGELERLQADFPAWISEQGLRVNPLDLYMLAHYYVNAGEVEWAKAVLEMNMAAFEGHPISASFLARLNDAPEA